MKRDPFATGAGRRPRARRTVALLAFLAWATFGGRASSQEYGEPDRASPGDPMIQAWLARRAEELHAHFLDDLTSLEDWQSKRARYREEYLTMLGLWPLPERTPLRTTVTGTVEGDGFVVEKLWYQSRPGLYVTANLYRPADTAKDAKLPAVLYVCGHSGMGRNGNKTAFQSHGIWFARHGYISLVVDTLQLGEIAAIHHGTYREGRWWWHSRGYTPAGVECWNGVRGIDLLVARDDVDPNRVAVTGISGGGAATFWIAAADERAAVAVPVSGMADLPSYVGNRVINGHCDCMFLHNAFGWPWTRIAALIAPRPLLFVNSDADSIFPMDANERIIARLERLYSLYGASDRVDAAVSIGGHAYRKDIRQAAYRFINTWLVNDSRVVTDSEVDLVSSRGSDASYPIAPEDLRVFPTDADIPADELNTTIDQHFVPIAEVEPPRDGSYDTRRAELVAKLRELVFGALPDRIPPARRTGALTNDPIIRIETEPGIELELRYAGVTGRKRDSESQGTALVVASEGAELDSDVWGRRLAPSVGSVFVIAPRGTGATRFTTKNPPNYVERSHVLLGLTVDTARVRDVVAAARYLAAEEGGPVTVAGAGDAAVLAIYAAVLEPDIGRLVLERPPATHMDPRAPALLNVLRVLDIPDALGLVAPRPVLVLGASRELALEARAWYRAAGAADSFRAADE